MTPAEELRAAAEKLRVLAAEASPAPWAANQWGNVETADYAEVAEVWPLSAPANVNVNYIAVMHPGVGAALARMLEQAADALAGQDVPDDEPALAVARAILGQPDGSHR
ncbi:hypothetical protein [Streptomyces vinaceus]|uniref:hypothetical protein n=1 Tax=Streptomyces vinaceus TaxID=1960 RepID=UPI00367A0089